MACYAARLCMHHAGPALPSHTPLPMQGAPCICKVLRTGGRAAVNQSAMQCTGRSGSLGRLDGQDAEREARLTARRVHHAQRDQALA